MPRDFVSHTVQNHILSLPVASHFCLHFHVLHIVGILHVTISKPLPHRGFKNFCYQAISRVIMPHIQFPPCLSLECLLPSSEPSLTFSPHQCDPRPHSCQNPTPWLTFLYSLWVFFSPLPSSVRGNWGTTWRDVIPKENRFLALTRKSIFQHE